MVQNVSIQFIGNVRGRESVTVAKQKLGLETLATRRKNNRHTLLMRILSDESNYESLVSCYEELMQPSSQTTTRTRAAARGNPKIYAKKSVYYNSFLLKTVRELKTVIQSPIIMNNKLLQ